MTTPINFPARFSFRDSQGRTSHIRFFWHAGDETSIAAGVASMKTLIQAMTSLQVWSFLDEPPPVVPRPVATQYVSAQDKANMVFQDTAAAFHRIEIAGPLVAIFFADQITVNGANAAVSAWVTLMLEVAVSESNVAYNSFLGGTYIRRKLPRRANITVLAPDGSSPEE